MAAAVLLPCCLLGGVGVVGGLIFANRVDSSTSDGHSAQPQTWALGNCLTQVAGPSTISPTADFEQRRIIRQIQQFEPVKCDDDRATEKITKIVATPPNPDLADSQAFKECPATTDVFHYVDNSLTSSQKLACTRLLTGPHPGDPGGGAGAFVVGDCVGVFSTSGVTVTNDVVGEGVCSDSGYFAQILAFAPTPAQCPSTAISRIVDMYTPGRTFCLGKGDHGQISNVGECVQLPSNSHFTTVPLDCTRSATVLFKITKFVEKGGACPSGDTAHQVTGYDRSLCGHYEYDGRRAN